MSYHYSYGPSLSDQGISPDDIEYAWRCDCGAEESTPGDLPKGWAVIEMDPSGIELAFRCERCIPKDHTFYLWDDTDDDTADLCGICGRSKSDHDG